MKTFTLKEISFLQDRIKNLSMIYQLDAKQEAALAFGKPIDYYYHFSYDEWMKVSGELVKKRNKVMGECIEMGIPGDMPFSEFPYYREQMGLDRQK